MNPYAAAVLCDGHRRPSKRIRSTSSHDRRTGTSVATLAAALIAALAMGSAAVAQDVTIRLNVGGRTIEGKPVSWSRTNVSMFGRDGRLWEFSPSEATDFEKIDDHFRPLTQGEMRGTLLREFGRGYEVSGTGNYLVVHPAGQRDKWAPRFESLYRSFMHYFTARSFRPQRPQFPLVAVAFPTRDAFDAYLARSGDSSPSSVLGYYSVETNRVLMYDYDNGQDDANWWLNAETIIHEATHQTAFNTGVHSRFVIPPRWVGEGLATMFEARGVWNSRDYPNQGDRINRQQLELFKRYASSGRPPGTLATFVASDRIFQVNSTVAYAEAWALTFFLIETMPGKYAQYLKATTTEPDATQQARMKQFTGVFGENLPMIEARFLRYMDGLR